MVEQVIVLRNDGTVGLALGTSELRFGYTRNKGIYRLRLRMQREWEDKAIRICWHTPDGEEGMTTLVQNECAEVPAAVTAVPGRGVLTVEGSDGKVNIVSADVPYRVGENSGMDDGTVPEPGTSAWEAFIKELGGQSLERDIASDEEVVAMMKEVFG